MIKKLETYFPNHKDIYHASTRSDPLAATISVKSIIRIEDVFKITHHDDSVIKIKPLAYKIYE